MNSIMLVNNEYSIIQNLIKEYFNTSIPIDKQGTFFPLYLIPYLSLCTNPLHKKRGTTN